VTSGGAELLAIPMKVAFQAAGFSTHAPASEAQASTQRAARVEALRNCVEEYSASAQAARKAFAAKWPQSLLIHGAGACCACKRLGYGATHCRATGQGCSAHGPVSVWARKAGVFRWCEGPSAEYHFPVGCHVQSAAFSGVVTAFDEASGCHTVQLDSDASLQRHYLAYSFKQCSVTYPDGVQVCSCGRPSPEEAAAAAAEKAEADAATHAAAEQPVTSRRSRRGHGAKDVAEPPAAEVPAQAKRRRLQGGAAMELTHPVPDVPKAARGMREPSKKPASTHQRRKK